MTTTRRLILALTLTLGIGSASPATLLAASPTLSLRCGIPSSRDIVTCRLSGRNFQPLERIHLTYRITYLAVPLVHGSHPQTVYRRHGMTDRQGTFTRPPLRFAVVRYHESYRLAVKVVGERGDRATTTIEAIAQ